MRQKNCRESRASKIRRSVFAKNLAAVKGQKDALKHQLGH
jgi:hypothetical protein